MNFQILYSLLINYLTLQNVDKETIKYGKLCYRNEIFGISKDWFDYESTNRITFLKDDKGLPIQKHGAYQVNTYSESYF